MPLRGTVTLERCLPIEEHARLVMDWRNDPHTLAMFYHHAPKVWESFWPEFCDTYFLFSELPPLFLRVDDERAGFVRFERDETPGNDGKAVAISVNIAPAYRGKGLGAAFLQASVDFLRKTSSVEIVLAEVRKENTASHKAFLKAGFRKEADAIHLVSDTGESCPITRYSISLSRVKRALLLDLDGTLADSLAPLKDVYRRFLGQFGVVGSEEEFQELNGPPLPKIITHLRRVHNLAPSEAELLALYRSLLRDIHNHVPPAEGALAVLQSARAQGWRIAVVTSSTHATAEQWLRQNGLHEWVEVIVGGDDVSRGKPDPEPYRLALQRLGADAAHSLAVEDSSMGVLAATDAGVPTLVINPSNVPSEHWLEGTRHIAAFSEVARWLA